MFSHKKVMQDNRKKNWRSVEMNLNKSRHTISRMPGKRHRKSLYCRHREQLWGDKKGNWYYWDCWYLCLPVCLFACMFLTWEKKKEKNRMRESRPCRFNNMCPPTNMREYESHLWINKEVTGYQGKWMQRLWSRWSKWWTYWLNSRHAGGVTLDYTGQEAICESVFFSFPLFSFNGTFQRLGNTLIGFVAESGINTISLKTL